MPKIAGGALASANDDPTVPDGFYVVSIEKAGEVQKDSGSVQFEMLLRITESADDETQRGRTIYYSQNIVKKDKTVNDIGLGQVKGVVKRILGEERANDPEFDSDELLNVQCGVQVKRETSTYQGQERVSNAITQWLPA